VSAPVGGASPRWRRDLAVLLAALGLLLGWDASGLDLAVMRLIGRPDGFALREAWVTSTLLHSGGRMLAWGVVLLMAVDAWRPQVAGPSRRERRLWLAVTVAAVVLVPGIKRISRTSCPWDLAEFGGPAAHVSHWAWGVLDGGPGHCFPSGHAAGAFCFLSGYFLLRGSRPGLARLWLAGTLGAGALFGLAQTLRGAHYPSHTLWTAWLCAAVCVAVAAVDGRRRAAS
jgi:membrane-associated PAP2 superfamily phosphatase